MSEKNYELEKNADTNVYYDENGKNIEIGESRSDYQKKYNHDDSNKNNQIKSFQFNVHQKKKTNICLVSGNKFIQQSLKQKGLMGQSQIENNVRLKYISDKKKYQRQKAVLKVEIKPQSFSNPQVFSDDLKKQENIQLDINRQSFTVGSLKNDIIQLPGNLKGIKACVIYNDVCLQDQTIAPIHLEVNYSLLNQTNNFQALLNNIEFKLYNDSLRENISYKTVENISNYLQTNKKKLKIADISQKMSSTFIQIVNGQEHSILEEGQKFKVGFQPSLKVEKRYLKLEHFFQKCSKNKKYNNNIDLIFDALQSIPNKISFSGIDIVLAELFMLVQERNINRKQYLERFDEENLMLLNKIEQMLQKSCILMKIEGDSYTIENFMLVADQKRSFNFGRMEYSDISFTSSQVSRQHGSIEYNQELDQWTIMDGVYENGRQKPSTFGLWLEVQQGKYYYIDNNQSIKIGNSSLLKFDSQNYSFPSIMVNKDTQSQDYYEKQKRKEIDEFLINLLEI